MKITVFKKPLALRVITAILALFAAFYMYDFYKCLSGFIANGFREPLVMLPMILAFFLPVLAFLFFFYDTYVRAICPVVKAVYSAFVAVYAAAVLALIFANITLYASNNALGVYDALPSIILHFPYDMIAVLAALLALQIFHLTVGIRKGLLDGIRQRGTLQLGVIEYLALSVLAIVVLLFTGAGVTATFTAPQNACYDACYVFLLLWVALVPLGNLLLLTLRPEKMGLAKRTKFALLGGGIGINLLFGALFLVLELLRPDFLVYISKPLFLIAFSVSMPIEPAVILAIMVLGTAILACRLVKTAKE